MIMLMLARLVFVHSLTKNYFCTKLRLFSQLRLLWRLLFTNIPLLFFNCLLMFCKYSPKLSLFIISFQLDSFSLLERCRFLLGSCIFLLLQGEDFFYIARWRFQWNFYANKMHISYQRENISFRKMHNSYKYKMHISFSKMHKI